MKSTILIVVDHYPPRIKFGGTLRSVENTIENFGDGFEFFILTKNTDVEI
jgi:hypothetical protein